MHANVSGVHNRFGDEFHCRDGDYLYDEFGDLCGASKGNSPDDSGQDGVQLGTMGTMAKEGNDMIDLTNNRSKTNTNNVRTVTSTIDDDSDVEIVDDPANLEEGIPIPENYIREKKPKRQKYRKQCINYVKFAQMDSVRVEEIPWDVDRDQKYTIECEEDEYIDKSKDGCWFEMHTSSCKGLDGRRKSGVCIGSLMCENKSCPKLLTEGIPNTNEFTKDSNVDVCKSCGYFVPCAPCGVLKLVEYDRDTKMMTVIYEGEHNCRPKPNLKKKFDILKDITKDTTCVRTPADARRQVIKKLLAEGKISEAIAVTCKMDDTSLLEKMRYMSKDVDTCKGQEDDIEAFRNLKTLKEDADKVDTNLIYVMNCGAINSGPTYVFKTSRYALETAVKMDATRKTVHGKASILSLEKAFFDGMHSRCKGYKTLTL